MTKKVDVEELPAISSQLQVKGQNYFTAEAFTDLSDVTTAVMEQPCTRTNVAIGGKARETVVS